MGTAVTEPQVNTLKKLSKNLVLALDADADNDFLLWQYGYGAQSTEHGFGDADFDGDVDGDDFLVWQCEFSAGSGLASEAVPEPASMVLVLVMAAMGILSRRGEIRRLPR